MPYPAEFLALLNARLKFVNWDGWPVVRFDETDTSFAVLGGPVGPWDSTWTELSHDSDADVFHTGYVWDQATWCSVFRGALKAAAPWPGFALDHIGRGNRPPRTPKPTPQLASPAPAQCSFALRGHPWRKRSIPAGSPKPLSIWSAPADWSEVRRQQKPGRRRRSRTPPPEHAPHLPRRAPDRTPPPGACGWAAR